MNDGMYLEMANGLQEVFNKKEKEMKEHIEKYNEIYKSMTIIYGLIRTFQENDDEFAAGFLIEEIRSISSSSLFQHLQDDD